jgi:hypothetical protein
LISCHFAGKDELIEQVVAEVVAAGQAFMIPGIEAASGARARLRAYIQSRLYRDPRRAHRRGGQIFNALPREREGQAATYPPGTSEAYPSSRGTCAQRTGELRHPQRSNRPVTAGSRRADRTAERPLV